MEFHDSNCQIKHILQFEASKSWDHPHGGGWNQMGNAGRLLKINGLFCRGSPAVKRLVFPGAGARGRNNPGPGVFFQGGRQCHVGAGHRPVASWYRIGQEIAYGESSALDVTNVPVFTCTERWREPLYQF